MLMRTKSVLHRSYVMLGWPSTKIPTMTFPWNIPPPAMFCQVEQRCNWYIFSVENVRSQLCARLRGCQQLNNSGRSACARKSGGRVCTSGTLNYMSRHGGGVIEPFFPKVDGQDGVSEVASPPTFKFRACPQQRCALFWHIARGCLRLFPPLRHTHRPQ